MSSNLPCNFYWKTKNIEEKKQTTNTVWHKNSQNIAQNTETNHFLHDSDLFGLNVHVFLGGQCRKFQRAGCPAVLDEFITGLSLFICRFSSFFRKQVYKILVQIYGQFSTYLIPPHFRETVVPVLNFKQKYTLINFKHHKHELSSCNIVSSGGLPWIFWKDS